MEGAKYGELCEGNLFKVVNDLRLGWRFTFQKKTLYKMF